jgi:outer membrane protein
MISRFLLLFLLLPSFSFSQEVWSLKKCIEHAMENNIQVRQALLNTQAAGVNLKQSIGNTLPTLNSNASHTYNIGRTIDPFTNQFANDMVQSNNFSLSSGLMLFNGFQITNAIRQNQFDYLAARHDADKTKNDIALNIAAAYLQILFSEELVRIAENQVDISRQQVHRTKKMFEAGTIAKNIFLDIEAQLATEELQKVNSENQRDMAYLTLKQLLYLSSDYVLRIEQPDLNLPATDILAMSPEKIYEVAHGFLPEIQSAEQRLKSSDKGLSIARGTSSPRLMMSGAYGTGYSGLRQELVDYQITGLRTIGYTTGPDPQPVVAPEIMPVFEKISFDRQINENLNKTVGIFLTVPIFNNWQARANIARAKIARSNAEYNLQQAELQVQRNVQQAFADAVAALKKFHATGKAMDALKESFRFTEQRFNTGIVNVLDYNNAKTRLMNVESELLQAKYDYIFKIKILDFYQGKPLTL